MAPTTHLPTMLRIALQAGNPLLTTLFDTQSFAVIGASRDPKKVGYQIFSNLQKNKTLKVFPVNPNARSIAGIPCFASILDIQKPVEIAIIAVPIQFVETAIQECIEKKVKAVVLITAGFAELSTQGKNVQQRITQELTDAGIIILGPNSLGFIAPHQNVNASFASADIAAGSLGIVSQSGAMLTALFSAMSSQNIGCSFALSLGNKSGLTEIDALEFASRDPHTKVIGLYLESFSNIPAFFELCSQISKKKPIILIKGGKSKQGQTASISHTAALATNFELLKSAEKHMGFVLVDSIEEFVRTLFFIDLHRSVPTNILVITNAGGPAVNTVDLVAQAGVPLASWSERSKQNIVEELAGIQPSNPLDLLGDAQTDRFQFAIRQAQRDPNIDALLIIITQQAVTHLPQITAMIEKERGKKPLFISLIGGEQLEKFRQRLRDANIVCTEFPNQIVDLLGTLKKIDAAKYLPTTYQPFITPTQFRQSRNETTDSRLSIESIDQAFSLLNTYGFQIPRYVIAHSEKDIKHFVYPLYEKTANLQLKHKKKVGGVVGMIGNDEEAKAGYKKLSKFGSAVLFQELVQANGEFLLGATRDPQFGWYIAFGLGGEHTDILQDRVYIFPPMTRKQIVQIIKSSKAYVLIKKLEEQNGSKGSIKRVVDCISNLQKLIKEHPELTEVEINPLMVNPQGFWAVDVKMS